MVGFENLILPNVSRKVDCNDKHSKCHRKESPIPGKLIAFESADDCFDGTFYCPDRDRLPAKLFDMQYNVIKLDLSILNIKRSHFDQLTVDRRRAEKHKFDTLRISIARHCRLIFFVELAEMKIYPA